MSHPWPGVYRAYRDWLPKIEDEAIVTLLEGNTPLIPLRRLPKLWGLGKMRVAVKYEGLNPTGSFKDRGMCVAVSRALSAGAKALICASTGNTSASAAAYGARAGIPCHVLIPKGKIAMGKLAQALVHGANVIQIEGNFDEALCFVKKLGERAPLTIVNSINPDRIEGQKTAAIEIIGSLGGVPDIHCLPVGNAGNITAYWKGYKAYASRHGLGKMPRMLGFQAEGAAPIVLGKKVDNPETIATAIRIGNPASWEGALQAAKESNGAIRAVSDEEILEAYRALASSEGVFCEPASAASLAGLKKAFAEGLIPEGSEVVCTLTGHGLKDPDIVVKSFEGRFVVLKTFAEVESVLLGART